MLTRRLEREFARRRERFAEPFYARNRAHVTGRPSGCGLLMLALSGFVAAVTLLDLFAWSEQSTVGWGAWMRAGVAASLFLLFVFGAIAGARDEYTVRVLPYFERDVGGIDTFLSGEALVWHSRELDDAAAQCGVTRLSAFASGDDLIAGERVCWFEAADGLCTAERLLGADVAGSLPAEVVTDLERLRDALRWASGRGIRFGLLVREGSYASGHEMSQRKGSFF